MIQLHPIPNSIHKCPYCNLPLEVKGWYIPGMRNLADLRCPNCEKEFYGDLLSGHALYYPMLLEKNTGKVYDNYNVVWFSRWLHDSYVNRKNSLIEFKVEEFKPLKNVILLNCLDTLYGHSLLKLLNSQYYIDHRSDLDLIIIIPKFLRWMVPDGVAAIWTVDLPLNRGTEWNDWLASEIKKRVMPMNSCWLSVAFSHPHPKDYDITRFTKIDTFRKDQWDTSTEKPMITFIWREDRCWDYRNNKSYVNLLKHKLFDIDISIEIQKLNIIDLAQDLKRVFPNIDFALIGLGNSGEFPSWIKDMRVQKIDEETERKWCERYAKSHITIGVHGSSMLLPSAHSGSIIDLMPEDRWGNVIQDLLLKDYDCRDLLFTVRLINLSISARELSHIAISMLKNHKLSTLRMSRIYLLHDSNNINSIHELEAKYKNII